MTEGPWDKTGETEIEYCRRVARENEPQTFRLHIKDELDGRMLSNGLWRWRMIPGANVSIESHQYRVKRIVPHPELSSVDVVWVESTRKVVSDG